MRLTGTRLQGAHKHRGPLLCHLLTKSRRSQGRKYPPPEFPLRKTNVPPPRITGAKVQVAKNSQELRLRRLREKSRRLQERKISVTRLCAEDGVSSVRDKKVARLLDANKKRMSRCYVVCEEDIGVSNKGKIPPTSNNGRQTARRAKENRDGNFRIFKNGKDSPPEFARRNPYANNGRQSASC